MSNEFTCAHCGGTFEKGWSDDEAAGEYAANFPERAADPDKAVVCDDCYNAFMKWFKDKPRVAYVPLEAPAEEKEK